MRLKNRIVLGSATGGIAVLASMAGLVAFAAAAVTPTVTATVQNNSNSTISTALIGTSVHANVVVASSTATTSPAGTVDFSFYNNQSCSGSPLVQTGVSLVNGAASSSNATMTASGLSYKVHYNGQVDVYTEADSACASVSATQFAPAITLSLSNNNVQAGSFVYGIPNLTGESGTASGTIQYNVYSNNTCSTLALNAGQKAVTNGATPNSDSFQFNTPGTYWWRVAYSGDLDNAATSSICGTVLTVVATSSTPTTTPSTPGTISGTVFNDLNKDGDQDAGEPGLSGWKVWLHQTATTTAKWGKKDNKKKGYNSPIVMTATTDANGNYVFANLQPGSYFIEQEEPQGWDQKSSDRRVVLNNSTSTADVDFANVQKNTGNGNGSGDDNDDDHGNKGGNGKHNGWQRFIGNLSNFDGWIKWKK